MEFHLSPVKEIVVLGERGNPLEREVLNRYLPNTIVAFAESAEGATLPLLQDRSTVDGSPTAYVCENFVCQRPVTEPDQLVALLNIPPPAK
jgi:hypothetical protein